MDSNLVICQAHTVVPRSSAQLLSSGDGRSTDPDCLECPRAYPTSASSRGGFHHH